MELFFIGCAIGALITLSLETLKNVLMYIIFKKRSANKKDNGEDFILGKILEKAFKEMAGEKS